ncbi:MAG: stage III sporulation protein AE [Evtepia sp.]
MFLPSVYAAETSDVLEKQSDLLNLDALQKAGEDYVSDIKLTPQMNVNGILGKIFENGKGAAQGIVKRAVRSCMLLLSITLLFGLGEGVRAGIPGEGFAVIPLAAALAITAVAVSDMYSLVGMGKEAIAQMELFSKALLPTVTMSMAASGAAASAAVKQFATILFSDFLITVINNLLMPLCFAYIAANVAYAAVGNEGLKRIGNCIKWIIVTTLTVILLAFIGYLNMSGVIACGADALTVKAAKFTISNMVPVVGGIISDAAESLLVGASMLRNAVGVFGMLVIFGICFLPFLHLGVQYLAYKCTATLTATVTTDSRISGLIDAIGSAFGLVMGMTASCALLIVIAMISAVSATVMG